MRLQTSTPRVWGAKCSRVEATEDFTSMLESAFETGGVYLITTPIDYSEILRVLVQELDARAKQA